jgi:hypothetical protein
MSKPAAAKPAKSGKKGAKSPSPKKARHAPNMRDKLAKKKEKPEPAISVQGFVDPLTFEIYDYTITPTKPGFSNKFKMWAKGELHVEALTAANFVGFKYQRDNENSGNEPLMSQDGYARIWMLRFPPENESTADTRAEGLRVLKEFFLSKVASDYPPLAIKLVDNTTDVPAVMEKFLLDADIEEIVRSSIDITEVEEDFYTKYPTFAKTIYFEKEPSVFAKVELGFPSIG